MKHLVNASPGSGVNRFVTNCFSSSVRLLALWAIVVPMMVFSSCASDPIEEEAGGFDTRAGSYELFDLVPSSSNDMTVNKTGTGEYSLTTTGADPYISTTALTKANPSANVVLTFMHKGSAIDDFQIYFSPLSEARSISGLSIPASDDWVEWSVVLKAQISQFNWGAVGHYVRLDFGRVTGKTISVKNVCFREASAGDKEVLNLVVSSAHHMTASEPIPSSYRMVTNGEDPYIFTSQLTRANPANAVNLRFQYKSTHTIGDVQIFFGDPITQDRSVYWLNLPAASEWTDWTMDMSAAISDFNWGAAGSRLRFDFGGLSGRTIEMRNIRFEEPDYELLGFVTSSKNQLNVNQAGSYEYEFTTTGADPYIQTTPLQKKNPSDSYVLTFEYKAPQTINDVQIFLGPPVTESGSVRGFTIDPSSEWKEWSVQLTEPIIDLNWGLAGNYLRLDLGNETGKSLRVRNLHFRPLNDQEQGNLSDDASMVVNLKKYFKTTYSSQVSQVNVFASTISVSGSYSGTDSYSLCEVPPYQNVTEIKNFEYKTQLSSPSFNIQFDRYVQRGGINYDRALSKWVVVKNGNPDEIVSHARYADAIQASQNLSEVPLTGKKGLSDYSNQPLQTQDLDDLGIKSVTVNIPLSDYMYSTGGGNRIAHSYGGKTFYFDAAAISRFDNIMLNAHRRSIPVAAIILVRPAHACPDQVIGNALQYPSYDASIGIFTMPNTTTAEGTNTYAAALDFFAARYCRSDNQYGRISKWIMHNEVDMGIHWNNMGNKHIMLYMDAYVKSLKMCSNIARCYDSHAEVLGSFSHSWAVSADSKYYPVLDMINILKSFSNAEGDFRWGLAYHSYPIDLTEPKTWLDGGVTFSADSPYVTFKNLEVLSAWANQSSNKYKGTVKRSVWLSENGTNSRSNGATHLKEQAAGMAYAWKKINALSGIDAIQWHNWFDNPAEGLGLGLRKSPDNNYEPKPVWHSYKAAGTAQEDSDFEQYKSIIGITDWNQIMHTASGF